MFSRHRQKREELIAILKHYQEMATARLIVEIGTDTTPLCVMNVSVEEYYLISAKYGASTPNTHENSDWILAPVRIRMELA